MKIIKKIGILIVIILGLYNCLEVNVSYGKADLKTDISGFESNITTDAVLSTKSLRVIVNRFLGFLRIISALVLVIVLGTTGYEFIVATPAMKEQIKNKMLPVILGTLLVFSAVSIAGFILGAIGG